MAAVTISGSTPPAYTDRAAQATADKLAWRTVALITSLVSLICVLGVLYFASLPREVPVIVPQSPDGAYTLLVRTTTPNEAGKEKMLADWIGACRIGSNDPQSIAARQCIALIPVMQGNMVAQVVAAQNQIVASQGLRVSVVVRSVQPNVTPNDYAIEWDEQQTAGTLTTTHVMRAYVSIAFAPQKVLLHGDPLMNPFGMYVTSMRTIDEGAKK